MSNAIVPSSPRPLFPPSALAARVAAAARSRRDPRAAPLLGAHRPPSTATDAAHPIERAPIDLRERIVEELIYERVQLDDDLHDLLALERDLGDSLRRAIAEAAGTGDPLALTDRCIARVFRRLAAEEADAIEVELATAERATAERATAERATAERSLEPAADDGRREVATAGGGDDDDDDPDDDLDDDQAHCPLCAETRVISPSLARAALARSSRGRG